MEYRTGEGMMARGDYAAAIDSFKKAVGHDPRNAFYCYRLGAAYLGKGDLDSALAEQNKALVIAPDSYYPHYLSGVIYAQRRDIDQAITSLNKAVSLWSPAIGDTLAFEMLGTCYLDKGLHEDALKILTRSYQINPRSPVTICMLGVTYDRMNDKEKAMKFYKEYLGLKNNNASLNRIAATRISVLSGDRLKEEPSL